MITATGLQIGVNLLLMVFTGFYVWLTWRILREERRANERLQQPGVQAILRPNRRWGQLFQIVIRNTGCVPVHDIRAEVSPKDLPAWGSKTLGELQIFNITIPLLLESEEIYDNAFSYLHLVGAKRQDSVLEMRVSYTDPRGHRHSSTSRYDLGIYAGLPVSGEKDLSDVVKELETIREQSQRRRDEVIERLDRLEWRLGPLSRIGDSNGMLESILRTFVLTWRDSRKDERHLVYPCPLKIRLIAEELYYSLCAARRWSEVSDDLRDKLLRMFEEFPFGPKTAEEFTALGGGAAELAEGLLLSISAEPESQKTNAEPAQGQDAA